MTSSKKCFKCSRHLPVSMFYKNHRMTDGYMGKCRECTRADVAKNRIDKIDYYRQYDKERAKDPERAKASYKISNRWRTEDKRRSSAHNKVARALRSGLLERQPCCICGSEDSLAHHESYDRPLEVVWYCQPHHKARHKEMVLQDIEP